MTRKPSCLISCSHNAPVGGCMAVVGRHGGTKPAGKNTQGHGGLIASAPEARCAQSGTIPCYEFATEGQVSESQGTYYSGCATSVSGAAIGARLSSLSRRSGTDWAYRCRL